MKWFLLLVASWPALSQQGPETLWIQGQFADSKLSLDRARIRSGYAPPSLDVTDAELEMARGDYAEANALLERARQNSSTHVIVDSLAELRLAQGQLQESEKLALTGFKWDGRNVRNLRLDDPELLLTLAKIYSVRGRPEARALFERSLVYAKRASRLVQISAHIGLARAMLSSGDLPGAASRAQGAFERSKEQWTTHSIPVMDALDTLGTVRLAEGQIEEAEKLVKATLLAREVFYGQRHVKVAESLLHLARIKAALGEPDRAIELADQGLKTYHDIFTGLNVWSALALVESGDIYDATGAHDEAQRRYRESLTVLDRFLGAETPAVQSVRARIRRGP